MFASYVLEATLNHLSFPRLAISVFLEDIRGKLEKLRAFYVRLGAMKIGMLVLCVNCALKDSFKIKKGFPSRLMASGPVILVAMHALQVGFRTRTDGHLANSAPKAGANLFR